MKAEKHLFLVQRCRGHVSRAAHQGLLCVLRGCMGCGCECAVPASLPTTLLRASSRKRDADTGHKTHSAETSKETNIAQTWANPPQHWSNTAKIWSNPGRAGPNPTQACSKPTQMRSIPPQPEMLPRRCPRHMLSPSLEHLPHRVHRGLYRLLQLRGAGGEAGRVLHGQDEDVRGQDGAAGGRHVHLRRHAHDHVLLDLGSGLRVSGGG